MGNLFCSKSESPQLISDPSVSAGLDDSVSMSEQPQGEPRVETTEGNYPPDEVTELRAVEENRQPEALKEKLEVSIDDIIEEAARESETGIVEDVGKLHIVLVPHVHTLFCERKQRICGSVGKVQELEYLKFVGTENEPVAGWCWTKRTPQGDEDLPESQNCITYQLSKEDIGKFLLVRYTIEGCEEQHYTNCLGPVLAAPPRLQELAIRIEGGQAIATSTYIGGYEGDSVYWWLRIRDGQRENLGGEMALNSSPDRDPRLHVLTKEDHNCVLKVKCRPVREDGAQGEIFTSKASELVEFSEETQKESE